MALIRCAVEPSAKLPLSLSVCGQQVATCLTKTGALTCQLVWISRELHFQRVFQLVPHLNTHFDALNQTGQRLGVCLRQTSIL